MWGTRPDEDTRPQLGDALSCLEDAFTRRRCHISVFFDIRVPLNAATLHVRGQTRRRVSVLMKKTRFVVRTDTTDEQLSCSEGGFKGFIYSPI